MDYKINNLFKLASLILKYGEDELRDQIKRKIKNKLLYEIENLLFEITEIKGPGLKSIQAAAGNGMTDFLSKDASDLELNLATKIFTRAVGEMNVHLEFMNPNLVSKETLKRVKDMIQAIEILLARVNNIDQEVDDYFSALVENDWHPDNFPEGHYAL